MFRIACFEKVRRQTFKGFKTKGFCIGQCHELMKGGRPQNTTDKRRKYYYEVNYYTQRNDKNGNKIYKNDIVIYKPDNIIGLVDWSDRRAAFCVYLQRSKFKIPYTILKAQERSIEIVGNLYENPELLTNKLRRK